MSSTKHHTASPWHGRNSTTARALGQADHSVYMKPERSTLASQNALDGTEAANDQPHATPASLAGLAHTTATQRRTEPHTSNYSAGWRAGFRVGWRKGLVNRITVACCAFAASMGTAAVLIKLGAMGL